MDWDAIVPAALRAIPWLVVVLVIVLLLRPQIAALVSRLGKLKAGDVEAEFHDILERMDANKPPLPSLVHAFEHENLIGDSEHWDSLFELAVNSPGEAVQSAWDSLTLGLSQVAARHGVPVGPTFCELIDGLLAVLPDFQEDRERIISLSDNLRVSRGRIVEVAQGAGRQETLDRDLERQVLSIAVSYLISARFVVRWFEQALNATAPKRQRTETA